MSNTPSGTSAGSNSKNNHENLAIAERRILELLSKLPVTGFPDETTDSADLELYVFELSNLAGRILQTLKDSYGSYESNIKVLERMQWKWYLSEHFPNWNDSVKSNVFLEFFGAITVLRRRNHPNWKEMNLESIEKSFNQCGIDSIFPETTDRNLAWMNFCAKIYLFDNESMSPPSSVIMEIPLPDVRKFWILLEKVNWRDKQYNITIFSGDKEPNEKKIKLAQATYPENNGVHISIFRDQFWPFNHFATWTGACWVLDSILRALGNGKSEKLNALILLGLAPLMLKKEGVSELYSYYGMEIERYGHRETGEKTTNDKTENLNSSHKRSYPYESAASAKYGKFMESDENEESVSRVSHKRLLPCIRRQDWTHFSCKPSQRAKERALEQGFRLLEGIGFPELGTCIRPEKLDQFFQTLEVNNIEEAVTKLTGEWEIAVIRYETMVVPKEHTEELAKTVRGKIGRLIPLS